MTAVYSGLTAYLSTLMLSKTSFEYSSISSSISNSSLFPMTCCSFCIFKMFFITGLRSKKKAIFSLTQPVFGLIKHLTTLDKGHLPRYPKFTAYGNYYSNFKIQITNCIIFNKIMNIITLIKIFERIHGF